MTTSDAARSRPRAFWADARFFLGLLLIAASIAGVWLVVSTARETVPVLAAERTLVPGDVVTAADVHTVDVALGEADASYLAPGDLTDGMVAARTVAAGELVPATAVESAEAVRTTTVVFRSATDVPSSVGPGSIVEVWSAAPIDHSTYEVPSILVADATVVSVDRDEGVLSDAAAGLEVVIPRVDVASVLAAVAGDHALSVVPTGGAR